MNRMVGVNKFSNGLVIFGPKDRKRQIYVQNPTVADFPYVWKVFCDHRLVGAYKSEWEAYQCRDRIILNGGLSYE